MTYILWDEYVKSYVELLIMQNGGLRNTARKYGIDPGVISKMKTGQLIPTAKTFVKWFPEAAGIKVEKVVVFDD